MNQLYSLRHFGFLSVTGKDALKFLQGYTTCDLEDLSESHATPGAICNIKGRMVSNFRASAIAGGFLLRMSRSLVTPTEEFLKKYIVFSKAELNDMSDIYQCFGLMDLDAQFPTENTRFTWLDEDIVIAIDPVVNDRDIPDSARRYEIWTTSVDFASNNAASHSWTICEENDKWHSAEIASGFAWVDTRSTDRYIPQMFNLHQTGGINFEKGCYLGQEIIARLQFRGNLAKRLHHGEAKATVAEGDSLFNSKQKTIGTIVAVQYPEFLAVIQTKSSDDRYLIADGSRVAVTDLGEDTA